MPESQHIHKQTYCRWEEVCGGKVNVVHVMVGIVHSESRLQVSAGKAIALSGISSLQWSLLTGP